MIAGQLQQKIGEALKAHDEVRVSTLRLLSSAFNYERIAKQHELSDEEELVVIKKEAKKRQEAIEIYSKVGEAVRTEKETKELNILKEFLPTELSEEEVTAVIKKVISDLGATQKADFGKVMKEVASLMGNRFDGKIVSSIVSKLLV